jgi:hypothetical protein
MNFYRYPQQTDRKITQGHEFLRMQMEVPICIQVTVIIATVVRSQQPGC